MIRPLSINAENHTASFKCDIHSGLIENLNLNTDTSYDEDMSCIIIEGSKLTESCNCITCFPIVGGNEDAQALALAKTE